MPAGPLTSGLSLFARELVDLILLGPAGDRRQLQDSPILGDVWLDFAKTPCDSKDLLITPQRDSGAGPVAKAIATALRQQRKAADSDLPSVAFLQGLVAVKLSFRELLTIVVPRTFWWKEQKVQKDLLKLAAEKRLMDCLKSLSAWASGKSPEERKELSRSFSKLSPQDRYVALAGIILWRADHLTAGDESNPLAGLSANEVVKNLQELLDQIARTKIAKDELGTIWQVSLNRKALPALQKSVPAVKGDAARTLFNVNCENIRWAILDSGIDSIHPALQGRVIRAYDFRNIRQIVNLDNQELGPDKKKNAAIFKSRFKGILPGKGFTDEAIRDLKVLAEDAGNDRPIHWDLVEKFITVRPNDEPAGAHGTHVAGIIGGNGVSGEANGMCPDIKLLDFRVLGKNLDDTEFSIIAALQFIRYLNEKNGYTFVHGANLSLSISHDVRNFACGRTPVCNECERLVNAGVVVVAAAGNRGYQSFETHEGAFESYAAFSITDPGNADGVITVGSTHRFRPHTYGVSFFSSRGPTGDGRLKPDLVAPGERIRSCVPGNDWGELDGTSMAAPHVSGAAAMLMARYSELIGEPREIKRILCESATDLGRERSFQGRGMLDVLRAFQSI